MPKFASNSVESRLFQPAVSHAPISMIIVDRKGNLLYANRETQKIFGYRSGELIGKPVEMLIPDRFRNPHKTRRAEFAKDPRPRPMGKGRDLYGLTKDGREIRIEVGLNSLAVRGIFFVIASIIDVTERKRLEEIKDEFVSTVSHELRAPLTVIEEGLSALLHQAAASLKPEEAELLKRMDRNGKRLAKLIDDILGFSSLKSGKVKCVRRRISLDTLIHETVENARATLGEGKILLEKIERGLHLYADKEMIFRVLTNLLQNAAHFAKSKIVVKVRRGSETGGNKKWIETVVMDDGPGIPKERHRELFEKFVRLHRPEENEHYKGTGLGLAICKEIIEKHHGKIWAESTPGKGARFHFTLPATIP